MNIDYLMHYLSSQLHTLIRLYTPDWKLIKTVCERIDFTDHLEEQPKEHLTYLSQTASSCIPIIYTDKHAVAYATVNISHGLFLIGPVKLMENGTYKHYLPEPWHLPEECLASLYSCTLYFLLKETLLAYNLTHEMVVSLANAFEFNCLEEKIKHEVQKNYHDIVFQNQELTFRHNPYDQEIREFSSISNGDVEQLSKSWEEDYVGRVGILSKDSLRHCKNLGIVLVTLGARAAIHAGVLSEIAFSLSDSYINKIEEAKNPEAAITLGRQAEYQYALMVKELKDSREQANTAKGTHVQDSKISQCKDYIFSHLHGKLSTSDIAAALYMNTSYLSELFKKEEGITISEYILQEKIKLVKNMLIYSRYSYIEIANYLGFTSQSYLGAKFKKITGMTLHQYREKYGVKEFDQAPMTFPV